ncbi:MAG: DNA adenine methylase [Nitrospirota bacterium]
MKTFIPWVGGKKRLAKDIVALLPAERNSYIEVFGGGGKVLFAKDKLAGEVEVYNDIHSDLVNLFEIVREKLPVFKRRQYFLLSSREEYKSFLKQYKDGKFKDDIDRAIAFYVLVKTSFGAGVTTGWGFSKVRPPKYPACLDDLGKVRERLVRVYIENLSFEKLIPKYDRPDAVFYCDPPYYITLEKPGYYRHELTVEDHAKLRDILSGIQGKVIVSYDDHPEVRKLYKGFNIQVTKPIHYSLNNRVGQPARHQTELLITNF